MEKQKSAETEFFIWDVKKIITQHKELNAKIIKPKNWSIELCARCGVPISLVKLKGLVKHYICRNCNTHFI